MSSALARGPTGAGRYFLDKAGLRWRSDVQALTYRIGPIHLGVARLRSCSLVTSFLNLPAEIEPPISRLRASEFDTIVYPALPFSDRISRLEFHKGYFRYVPRREDRYFITMGGTTFAAYMGRFSAKTRNTLRRHARRYADAAGGRLDWRIYQTADEMREFRDLALSISERTYQHAEGVGLLDTEEFAREMEAEGASGRARGYVLFFQDKPAAFVYCTIDCGILLYSNVGYDPDLSRLSPGRILLLEMIEALFEEGTIRKFDFGMEEYDYKSFFSTDHVRCARVFFFPWSVRTLVLVLVHIIVETTWQVASFAKGLAGRMRTALAKPQKS